MQKITYIQTPAHAGFQVRTDCSVTKPTNRHVDRIAYLITQVYDLHYGDIDAHRGLGIEVRLPQLSTFMDKGTFMFNTLHPFLGRHLKHFPSITAALGDHAYEIQGTRIGRTQPSGLFVPATPSHIEALYTPPYGCVPATGHSHRMAKQWARLFSEAFQQPETHVAQLHSLYTSCCPYSLAELYFGQSPVSMTLYADLSAEKDLALALIHVFNFRHNTRPTLKLPSTLRPVGCKFARAVLTLLKEKDSALLDKSLQTAYASGLWTPNPAILP